MQTPVNTTILSDLREQFEELPQELRRQLIAIIHELRQEVERTERKSVLIPDRSTQSWFARA